MNYHKLGALVFLLFYFTFCSAKIPKDILKKVLKATAAFEQYEIRFERHFKYPLEADTVAELYQSTVYRTDIEYNIGWHQISYLKSGLERSVLASNKEGLYRVNFNNNIYYSNLIKDNEKLVVQNLHANLYQPLLYSKIEWNAFDLVSKTDSTVLIEKIDTIKDIKQRIKFITRTTVIIDLNSYLPIFEETVSKSKGHIQFNRYKLLDYQLLSKNSYQSILYKSDSLIAQIITNSNGDSIKASKKDLYRKIKPGDPVSEFQSVLFDGRAFNLSAFKDSIVILDFFYTTCAPCIASIPELNAIYHKYNSRGLEMFGVNPFETDWENVNNFIKDYQVAYPIVKSDKQSVYNFGVSGFPRLFVIHKGIIVKIYYGFAKGMDSQLSLYIEKLLAAQ